MPDRRGRAVDRQRVFLEYEDVLSREALVATAPIGPEDRAALLDAVLGVGQWSSISYLRASTSGMSPTIIWSSWRLRECGVDRDWQ